MSNILVYSNSPGYNDSATILASAARTATPTAVRINNPCASGLHLIVDVTAKTATPSVVVTVSGVDPVTDKLYTVLASAAFDGTTETRVLKIFPGATADPNLATNNFLPKTIEISFVHGDADSMTYSAGAHFLR